MSPKIQNIIVVAGLVLLIGLGYYLYDKNKDSILATNTTVVSTQISVESADFLRRLNELKSLSFDDSIFTDPRFRSFADRQRPIIQKPIGRSNPFSSTD